MPLVGRCSEETAWSNLLLDGLFGSQPSAKQFRQRSLSDQSKSQMLTLANVYGFREGYGIDGDAIRDVLDL